MSGAYIREFLEARSGLDESLDQPHAIAMAKVTGKFQITLPKALVDQCGIRVGDELDLRSVGRSIQIDPRVPVDASRLLQERLTHFDRATRRQDARNPAHAGRPARIIHDRLALVPGLLQPEKSHA